MKLFGIRRALLDQLPALRIIESVSAGINMSGRDDDVSAEIML